MDGFFPNLMHTYFRFYERPNTGQCISRIQMYKKNNEIKLFLEHPQMAAPMSKRLQDLDCKTAQTMCIVDE